MIRDHVNAALRSMMLYFAIALFMIYTYTMFHFLYDHETAQVGSKTLHSNTADIQPIWSPLAIVANPLALLYLKCGLREWYGYRPHHRIARRMRSGANMRNGALTIANQLVVTRFEWGWRFAAFSVGRVVCQGDFGRASGVSGSCR